MSGKRDSKKPFWETTPLSDMSASQWESLCDGCGRCCLHKVEDTDTHEIFYTSVACKLLNIDTCRCRHYRNRHDHVSDCIQLRKEHLGHLGWLPESCAYRRLDEGRKLPDWHPLITGDPDSVHRAGISVQGRTVPEWEVAEEELEDHIIDDDSEDE